MQFLNSLKCWYSSSSFLFLVLPASKDEAASLAGHLNLDNLIVIFDDNGISIDGSTSLTVSEDHLAKFKAFGFEVEAIDGHDFDQIKEALQRANTATKPYFIACRTIIGKGTNLKAGSEKSHGSPLGSGEIEYLKNNPL